METRDHIFRVDGREMDRRQRAYDSLLISLTVGLVVGFSVFQLPLVFSVGFLGPVVILGITSRIWLGIFFHKYRDSRIVLSGGRLTRTGYGGEQTINFSDIRSLRILKTSRGLVRSLAISTGKGSEMVINGVSGFSRLADKLVERCPAAHIRHSREPVDYDHPLFYVFFGLILAVGTGGLASLLLRTDQFINFVVYTLIIALAGAAVLYLFRTRPLSGYYGN